MDFCSDAQLAFETIHDQHATPDARNQAGRWFQRLLSSSCHVPVIHVDNMPLRTVCWDPVQIETARQASEALCTTTEQTDPAADSLSALRDLLVPLDAPQPQPHALPYLLQLKLAHEPSEFESHLRFVLAQISSSLCTTKTLPWVQVYNRTHTNISFRWFLPYALDCCEPYLASVPSQLQWIPLPTGQLVPVRMQPDSTPSCQALDITARVTDETLQVTDLQPCFAPPPELDEPFSLLPLCLGLCTGLGSVALSTLTSWEHESSMFQLALHMGHWLGGSIMGLALGIRLGQRWRTWSFCSAAQAWLATTVKEAVPKPGSSSSSSSDSELDTEDMEVVELPADKK